MSLSSWTILENLKNKKKKCCSTAGECGGSIFFVSMSKILCKNANILPGLRDMRLQQSIWVEMRPWQKPLILSPVLSLCAKLCYLGTNYNRTIISLFIGINTTLYRYIELFYQVIAGGSTVRTHGFVFSCHFKIVPCGTGNVLIITSMHITLQETSEMLNYTC